MSRVGRDLQDAPVASQRRSCRLSIDEKGLCQWLGSASPGNDVEYHRGFLALDSMPHSGRMPEQDRVQLVRVARRAYWAMERGFVHLVQRRHGPDDYTYLAVARRRTSPSRSTKALQYLLEEESVS